MRQPRWLFGIAAALAALVGLGAGIAPATPAEATPGPTSVAACAFNDSVYNYDVSIEPVSPPPQSGATLRVAGVSADGCVPTFVRADLVPGGILIYAVETSCAEESCPAVLAAWSFDVPLGDLPPGAYSAELTLQCGEKSFQCAARAVSLVDVTPTATPAPTDTASPLPTLTPAVTPTPAPTATSTPIPTATAPPFVCDENNPTSVCNGIIAVRVFLDLRCDRFFNPGVDVLLTNARVTAHLPGDARRAATTNRFGDLILTGIQLPPGGTVRLVSDRPDGPWWTAASLAACPGGSELRLRAEDFGPLGIATVNFRWRPGD